MRFRLFAVAVILVSAFTGTLIARKGLVEDTVRDITRSPHRHALFYVVYNGSELNFTSERFQLNSGAVHLENGRNHIVHAHRRDVSWRRFLKTLNIGLQRNGSELCMQVYQREFCGKGRVVLNGKVSPDLDQNIEQGDNFLIIIQDREMKAKIRDYMERQLPRQYIPESMRGMRV
ncbi:MAG: hypothetical protein ABEK01_02930 [Candidatus Nanohaloarchaea archaeon]